MMEPASGYTYSLSNRRRKPRALGASTLPVLQTPLSFWNRIEVLAEPLMAIFVFVYFQKGPHCFTEFCGDPARLWSSDVAEGADPAVRLHVLGPVP